MCLKKLMKFAKKTVKKMTVWDMALLKTAVLAIGLIIGAYMSVFVQQYIWWFVGVAVITYAILVKRVFL